MINTIATFALGALMAAFAVCAGLLNEADHAARRHRKAKGRGARQFAAEAPAEALDLTA